MKNILLSLALLSTTCFAGLFEADTVVIEQAREGSYFVNPLVRNLIEVTDESVYVIYLPTGQDSNGRFLESVLNSVYVELKDVAPARIIVVGKHLESIYKKHAPKTIQEKTSYSSIAVVPNSTLPSSIGKDINLLLKNLGVKVSAYYILTGISEEGNTKAEELAKLLGTKSVILSSANQFDLANKVKHLQGTSDIVIINAVSLLLNTETGEFLGTSEATDIIKQRNFNHIDISLSRGFSNLGLVIDPKFDKLVDSILLKYTQEFKVGILLNTERLAELGFKSIYIKNFEEIEGVVYDRKTD